ncbi:hypothetical protein HanXRQr2_Chr11g0485691 [Helianthus annuus]|uniref:Uncharacterized protein n=1 Tax=Helianthus annuus TaxID=4232 RepID=A0A9K3HNT9_HELAN|nr:hypothetical protein HanXRQr2_Chr11g0485691 [Helianthus annuus]
MISDGEFIVLIPFAKKDKQKSVDVRASETSFQNAHQCSTSSSDKRNKADRRNFDILFDEVLNMLCDDDELDDNCAFI